MQQLGFNKKGRWTILTLCLMVTLMYPWTNAALADEKDANGLCAMTLQMAKSGLHTEASNLLEKQLKDVDFSKAGQTCIAETLAKVRARLIDDYMNSSKSLVAQGRLKEAVSILETGLEKYPFSSELQEKVYEITKLGDPFNIEISRAQTLVELGQNIEATKFLNELLKKGKPNLSDEFPIPQELKSAYGGKVYLALKRNLQRFSAVIIPIFEVLGIVIFVTAFFFMLYKKIFAKHRVLIEQFGEGSFEEKHFGPFFTSSVNSHLHELVRDTHRGGLNLVTGPIDNIKLPTEIISIVPDTSSSLLSAASVAKAIPAILNYLFSPRSINVSGQLIKAGGRGVGVSVSLSKSTKLHTAYTIWFNDFEDDTRPGRYDHEEKLYQLSEYLAIWIAFKITSLITKTPLNLLGTEDWRSYSYFKSGIIAGDDKRTGAAIRLFIKSLSRDKKHRGARLNLALKLNSLGKRGKAYAQLTRLYRENWDDEGSSIEPSSIDPSLYSALYNLAVYDLEAKDHRSAIRRIKKLLRRIESGRESTDHKVAAHSRSKLDIYLTEIEPSAKIMLGTLLVFANEESPEEILKLFAHASSTSVRHQYDLACAFSMFAEFERAKPDAEQNKIESFVADAMAHLEEALKLDDERVMQQVNGDPSLQSLRTHNTKEFEGLLAPYIESPESPEDSSKKSGSTMLAKFSLFSPRELRLLGELKVLSFSDLRAQAATKKKRKQLASQIGEPRKKIDKWVNTTELTLIRGIGPSSINHFLSVQVFGLKDLAKQKGQNLRDALVSLPSSPKDLDVNLDVVEEWISEAKNTIPLIE